jgi:hypothetical protein
MKTSQEQILVIGSQEEKDKSIFWWDWGLNLGLCT